jgi:hypothetical protein
MYAGCKAVSVLRMCRPCVPKPIKLICYLIDNALSIAVYIASNSMIITD